MKKTLIVISGGGFSQLENAVGCLKALEDCGIQIHGPEVMYHGTSAGAIAAGLMQVMTAAEAVKLIKATPSATLIAKKWFWPLRMWFGDCCAYSRTGLEAFLEKLFGTLHFDTVEAITTRLSDHKRIGWPGTKVTILASTSIQGIFPNTVIAGVRYIDGGYTDNVPLKDWQIAMYGHVYIILYPRDPDSNRHGKTAIGRVLAGLDTKLSQEVNEAELNYDDKPHYPTVTVLRPRPTTTSLLNWSAGNKLIAHAYKCAVDKLKQEGLTCNTKTLTD